MPTLQLVFFKKLLFLRQENMIANAILAKLQIIIRIKYISM